MDGLMIPIGQDDEAGQADRVDREEKSRQRSCLAQQSFQLPPSDLLTWNLRILFNLRQNLCDTSGGRSQFPDHDAGSEVGDQGCLVNGCSRSDRQSQCRDHCVSSTGHIEDRQLYRSGFLQVVADCRTRIERIWEVLGQFIPWRSGQTRYLAQAKSLWESGQVQLSIPLQPVHCTFYDQFPVPGLCIRILRWSPIAGIIQEP